jgi:hypothetical protein
MDHAANQSEIDLSTDITKLDGFIKAEEKKTLHMANMKFSAVISK